MLAGHYEMLARRSRRLRIQPDRPRAREPRAGARRAAAPRPAQAQPRAGRASQRQRILAGHGRGDGREGLRAHSVADVLDARRASRARPSTSCSPPSWTASSTPSTTPAGSCSSAWRAAGGRGPPRGGRAAPGRLPGHPGLRAGLRPACTWSRSTRWARAPSATGWPRRRCSPPRWPGAGRHHRRPAHGVRGARGRDQLDGHQPRRPRRGREPARAARAPGAVRAQRWRGPRSAPSSARAAQGCASHAGGARPGARLPPPTSPPPAHGEHAAAGAAGTHHRTRQPAPGGKAAGQRVVRTPGPTPRRRWPDAVVDTSLTLARRAREEKTAVTARFDPLRKSGRYEPCAAAVPRPARAGGRGSCPAGSAPRPWPDRRPPGQAALRGRGSGRGARPAPSAAHRSEPGSVGTCRVAPAGPPTAIEFTPAADGRKLTRRAHDRQAQAVAALEPVADRPELHLVLTRLTGGTACLAEKSLKGWHHGPAVGIGQRTAAVQACEVERSRPPPPARCRRRGPRRTAAPPGRSRARCCAAAPSAPPARPS